MKTVAVIMFAAAAFTFLMAAAGVGDRIGWIGLMFVAIGLAVLTGA